MDAATAHYTRNKGVPLSFFIAPILLTKAPSPLSCTV